MNYRHAFHAGNFADVLKHAIVARIIAHLNAKPTPWGYLDTHAGIGLYDLAGEEADRTGEWRNGVGRLRGKTLGEAAETLLAPWRQVLAELDPGDGSPGLYPGSPEIVRRLARAGDRLRLCERHPKDCATLSQTMRRDNRVKVVEIDGWTALGAWLPPRERRGLVLIDPPFEETDELERMASAFLAAHKVWPTGTYALWRPIKSPEDGRALTGRLIEGGLKNFLKIDLLVHQPSDPRVLSGSGLIVVNPPWTLEAEARAGLPDVARTLSQGPGAGAIIEAVGSA